MTSASSAPSPSDPPGTPRTAPGVDPRGTRFTAGATSVVLFVVLITGSALLLAAQAVVFALGAFAGPRAQPYAVVYRTLVAPRLGPPSHREDPAPIRFSQAVGLGFAVLGVAGYVGGLGALGVTATALALAAAFLNAVFGFCLGCEVYHRLPTRLRGQAPPPRPPHRQLTRRTNRHRTEELPHEP